MIELKESKELSVFKQTLNVFGEYLEKFAASGIHKYLDMLLTAGKKAIPSDSKAKDIIEFSLGMSTAGESVQFLLNRRFEDLPVATRPYYKDGNRHLVAFWSKEGGSVSDRIKDLINWNGEKSGQWVDVAGNKINLITE